MNSIIVTNNKMVRDKYSGRFHVEYFDVPLADLMETVRDMIHKNYKLLTHPLSGSIKPNESKYKSFILEEGHCLDYESVAIISESIMTVYKFCEMKKNSFISPQMDRDYMLIDMSLLEGCLF